MGEDEVLEDKVADPKFEILGKECKDNRVREVTGGLVTEKDFRLYELKKAFLQCYQCPHHSPYADRHYCHVDKEEQKKTGSRC